MKAKRLRITRVRIWAAAMAAGLPVSGPALGFNDEVGLLGTASTVVHWNSAGGKLEACGVEFVAVGRDTTGPKEGIVKITGSYNLYLTKNGLTTMLKLGYIDGAAGNPIQAPSTAFARAPNSVAPTDQRRGQADTPGYALFVGPLGKEGLATVTAIMEGGEFVVGFNRRPGSMDTQMPVDVRVLGAELKGNRVVRERSDKNIASYAACIDQLMKLAEADLKKPQR